MKSTSKSMIFSMVLRNILRNKRRSMLSAGTIFIVIVFGCVISSIIYGQTEDMQTNIINQISGDIRVRNQLYSDNERIQAVQFVLPQTEELLAFIKSQKGVVGAEPQINLGTTIYRDEAFTVATIVGLNFETSRFFTDRNTKIISGTIPSASDKNGAIITPFMANHFDLKLGDTFTTWLTRTANGGNNAVTFKVAAIAIIGNNDFAGLNFFVDWNLLSEKLRMNGNVLEILVHTEENFPAVEIENLILTIQNYAETDNPLEVKKWDEVGIMGQIIKSNEITNLFMSLFFSLMASTIIFNSTMMAVMERKKEIGTLMSLGMDAKHIKNLFLLESATLAFIASLAGAVIGFIVVSILGIVGINMLAFGLDAMSSSMGISTWIYPSLSFGSYIFILLLGTLTATVACILPSRMALRVQPAEALRSAE